MQDDRVCQTVEEVSRRFEAAWRSGEQRPAITRFLPPLTAPERAAVLTRLVKIDQRQRWRCGEQPLLESYLQEWPELRDSVAVVSDLLQSECEVRAALGASPTPDELQQRFPTIYESVDLNTVALRSGSGMSDVPEVAAPQRPVSRAPDTVPAAGDPTPTPPASWMVSSSGTRVGRYEIRTLLGAGGMGEVYRAYDTQLQREVALKIPRVLPGAKPEVLGRFVEEALAAASLRHPHICPVYDAGQMGDRYYIVMALIEGQTLAEKLEQGACDPAFSARIVAQLARALDAAHAKGIVHRDIKPANIMLDASEQPLLTDFGLARRAEKQGQLTVAGTFLGTPAYMSPEQAAMQPVDHRTDIYSLGVVLYQLLTGQLPYPGPPSQLPLQITQGKPPKPSKLRPDLDPALESICLQAMARQCDRRYPTAGALAEALEAYVTPVSAAVTGKRQRLLWGALVTAVVLLCVGITYELTIGRRAGDHGDAQHDQPLTPRAQRIADLEQTLAQAALFQADLQQVRELGEAYCQVKDSIFAMNSDVVRGQSALALGKLKRYAVTEKELAIVRHVEEFLGRTGLTNVPEDAYLLVRELAEMIDVRLSRLRQELESLAAEERLAATEQLSVAPDPASAPPAPREIAERVAETRRQLAGVQGAAPEISGVYDLEQLNPAAAISRNGKRGTLVMRCHSYLGRIYAHELTEEELALVGSCHDVALNVSGFSQIDRIYPHVRKLAVHVGARLELLRTKLAGLQAWEPDAKHFNALIETRPAEIQTHCDRARMYAGTRDFERAVEKLDVAIGLSPEDATLYALRATFQADHRNLDAAAADSERALALAPELGYAYYARGYTHGARGEFTLAVGDCDHAIQLDPTIKQAYVTRAVAYLASAAFDRAATDAAAALALDGEFADALRVRALAQLGKQELDQALEDSRQAIRLSPLVAENYVARARVLIQQQSYTDARDDLSQAIRLGPASGAMYQLRSTCYEKLGDPIRAAADSYRASELDRQSSVTPADAPPPKKDLPEG